MKTRTRNGGQNFRKEKTKYESNVQLDVGGMGTDIPQVGPVTAKVGDNHLARVRGSGQPSMW